MIITKICVELTKINFQTKNLKPIHIFASNFYGFARAGGIGWILNGQKIDKNYFRNRSKFSQKSQLIKHIMSADTGGTLGVGQVRSFRNDIFFRNTLSYFFDKLFRPAVTLFRPIATSIKSFNQVRFDHSAWGLFGQLQKTAILSQL